MSNYICPCCGKKYDIKLTGDYECSCGKEFHFEVKNAPAATEQICPFCKSHIPADALKCAHCGEWLAGKAPKSSTIYLLLAFFFGPWAEFYLDHIISGAILIMINLGLLALGAVHPGAFLLAGAFQFIYFIYACFVDVNPAPVNPAQQNKKSSGGGMWFCWIVIILALIGIAVAFFIANRPS